MSFDPGAPLDRREAWESSYANRDNFLFYPHEEVIRFVSKYICKRVGVSEFMFADPLAVRRRVLDLGCGIGRHVMYCHETGLEAYGIDLSASAVAVAHQWAVSKGAPELVQRIVRGDVRRLPWADGTFEYAVSHGVLDSMPYEIARAACLELSRVMMSGGLFYCDLVSGDDSRHAPGFSGEELVTTAHEKDTVQQYFDFSLIERLFEGVFHILECNLIRRENLSSGEFTSRYHLVLRSR